MKKLLHLLFFCALLPGAFAQTCNTTGLEIMLTQDAVVMCDGMPTVAPTLNNSSTLPNTEFFIINVDQPADNGGGAAIVGTSSDGVFLPSQFGLTHSQRFALRPFSYDIEQFRELVDFILNSTDAACCEVLEDLAKDLCDNLSLLEINGSENINSLEDVWYFLKAVAGNTGETSSVENFISQINSLNALTNIEGCRRDEPTDYCYALGNNEQLFKIFEAPQIVEVNVDIPHEITINSTISDGILEYSIDPSNGWQMDNIFTNIPEVGTAYVREVISQCEQEQSFLNASLNVELGEFKVNAEATTNLLSWITDTEIDNLGFGIERSADATNFTRIAWVDGAGNSEQRLNYVFRDPSPLAGQSYYRLAMEDTNGRIEESPIESVQRKDGTGFSILSIGPNPSANIINVSIVNNDIGDIQYFIYDLTGRKVREGSQELQIGVNNFTVDATIVGTGMYIFTAFKDDFVVSAYKFVMH